MIEISFHKCIFRYLFAIYLPVRELHPYGATMPAPILVPKFQSAQLFGPSYYTFVLANFTIANILIFYVFELKVKSAWLFVSGIFHGFAILCNPYLVLPYVAFSLCCVILPSLRKYIKKYILIWAGTVLIGTMFLIRRSMPEIRLAMKTP